MSGMGAYFSRRLLLVPFTFIAITLMVYSVLRVVPGGPIEQAEIAMKLGAMQGEAGGGTSGGDNLGNQGELQLDEESLRALQRYYSLDRPILIGYLQWLGLWPREHRTRVPASTLEKHSDVFETLTQINTAQTQARTNLQNLMTPLDLIYRNGHFYQKLQLSLNNIEDDLALPKNVIQRLIHLRNDGFTSKEEHLRWLATQGYTADGNDVYAQIDANSPIVKPIINHAQIALNQITLIDQKLTDVRNEFGYIIEDKGRIYYSEQRYSGIFQLNFGRSYTHGKPVVNLIISKMEVSIQFGLTGYILTWLVCIPLGVFKALKHKSLFDTGTSFIVFLGYAMPGFIVCLVLISTLAVNIDWLPLGGYKPDNIEEMEFFEALLGRFRHMLIPIIGYMVGSFASMTILMKNSLLDNLGADYVRTGFAKGLSERRVVFLHALRNSLIPITAGIGHAISLLFAGSFLIEKTCNIDGMGLLGYEAIIQRDYPIILATLVIGVLIRLFGNIFSDIVWAMIDPRIRFG